MTVAGGANVVDPCRRKVQPHGLAEDLLTGQKVLQGTSDAPQSLSLSAVAQQRANLAQSTSGKGFGPQSPRDLRTLEGDNPLDFGEAPDYEEMNLCNIHFHKNAEHKATDYNVWAGAGDDKGIGGGYKCSAELSEAMMPVQGSGFTTYGE